MWAPGGTAVSQHGMNGVTAAYPIPLVGDGCCFVSGMGVPRIAADAATVKVKCMISTASHASNMGGICINMGCKI